jgi:CPA1 family monovalent cation:H+ antiporter
VSEDALAVLSALLIAVVVIVGLYEVARRFGVPYPSLFVIGGAALGFVPGVPRIALDPDLVLLVFLPPLLFGAAFETPLRDLRANLGPIARLAFGLVIVTALVVAAVVEVLMPGLGWPAALTLGAIVAPTDALAATTVFRRLGVPRTVVTIVEGEALFNDATALILYRSAVVATLAGGFLLAGAVGDFIVATVGGIVLGYVVGRVAAMLLRSLDDPPVEVVISLVVPFIAYLPAEQLGLSGVLAVVSAGLVIGRRLATILSAGSRVMWLTTWKIVAFVLDGLAFILIGQALPEILEGLDRSSLVDALVLALVVAAATIVIRFVWVFLSSLLPSSPRRALARRDPALAWRLVVLVGWSGLRGAVSLAAALALPATFPARDLILLVTFVVIVVTLVGQGLTLPIVVRWAHWDGVEDGADELDTARAAMYEAGLEAVRIQRSRWPGHRPLLDRLEAGLVDRDQHLATDDPAETAERRQEHAEHQEIQQAVIEAQRRVAIGLRDSGEINDATLRVLERDLDLEELRMEA